MKQVLLAQRPALQSGSARRKRRRLRRRFGPAAPLDVWSRTSCIVAAGVDGEECEG